MAEPCTAAGITSSCGRPRLFQVLHPSGCWTPARFGLTSETSEDARQLPACLVKDCTLRTTNVHTTIFSGRAEEEVSGSPMTARQRPLRDCSGPCACYAEGHAAGKDKA